MSISSLQSLIQKYGANFGIKPQTDSASDGKGSQTAAGSASGSTSTSAGGDAKPADGKTPAGKLDSLDLSPAAREYLAAHTGPLGKFELPNMMDYFLNSDGGSDGAANGAGSSLADYLFTDPNANRDDDSNPLSSLSGFL